MSPLGVGTKRANCLERLDTSKRSGGGRTLRAWASSAKGKHNPVKIRASCPWAGVNGFLRDASSPGESDKPPVALMFRHLAKKWRGASFERGHQVGRKFEAVES